MLGMPGPSELIIIVIVTLAVVVAFWRIFAKAGFPGALSLLMFIPIVNVVMIFFLAFAEWPVLAKKGADHDGGSRGDR